MTALREELTRLLVLRGFERAVLNRLPMAWLERLAKDEGVWEPEPPEPPASNGS